MRTILCIIIFFHKGTILKDLSALLRESIAFHSTHLSALPRQEHVGVFALFQLTRGKDAGGSGVKLWASRGPHLAPPGKARGSLRLKQSVQSS